MKFGVCWLLSGLLVEPLLAGIVEISWDPNPPGQQVTGYAIYRKVNNQPRLIGHVQTNLAVLHDVPVGNHCFMVTAHNRAGDSLLSTEACLSVTTPATGDTIWIESNNAPPRLIGLQDITVEQGAVMSPVSFRVQDTESPARELDVSVISSDQELLPVSSVVLGGTDEVRTFTLDPVPAQTGLVKLTFTVTDPGGARSSATIKVAIHVHEIRPVITSISFLPDGRMKLSFTGEPGHTYVVQGSLDYVLWTDLGIAVELDNGHYEYLDEDAVLRDTHFFRIKMP